MMYLNLPSHFISDYSHCQLYCLPIALISDRPNLLSPCRAVVQGRKGECCYFSESWLWLSFCKIAQCSYAIASLLNSHSPYPASHCLSPSEHSVSVFNHLLHFGSPQEYLGLIFNAKHFFPRFFIFSYSMVQFLHQHFSSALLWTFPELVKK